MKKTFLIALLAFAAASAFAQQTKQPSKAQKPKTQQIQTSLDSVNYAYGVAMANSLKETLGSDLRTEVLIAALQASLKNEKTLLDADKANAMQTAYNVKAQARITEAYKAKNLDYLAKNKLRKEVTTTASGLQYEVMKKGTGTVSPKATDQVEVHYHGTLIDGTIFDSSVDRKQTATFPLNRVIPGWTEGLQYMKEGDKFKFFIPSNLAYGDRQAPGGKIKGGSTLIFEVELFKIIPQ